MFCEKCGAQLNENACFCSQCGNKIEYVQENNENELVEDVNVVVDQPEASCTDEIVTEEITTEEALVYETLPEDIESDNAECDDLVEDESVKDVEDVSVMQDDADSIQEEDVSDIIDEEPSRDTDSEAVEDIDDKKEDPVEEPTEVTKPIKKKRRIGAHIFSSFLSIILLAFVLVTVSLGIFKAMFSTQTIADTLSSIDLKDITVDDIADKETLDELGLELSGENVFDFIYDNIDQEQLADPLTKDEFEAIIENKNFGKYIGDVIDRNLDALLEGETTTLLTIDDVTDFLEKEKDSIEDVVGYEITDQRIENLRRTLNDSYSDVFENLKIDVDSNSASRTAIIVVSILLSDWLLILLIVFDVLLAVLIFLVMKSFRFGCVYCGIPLVFVGAIYTLASGLLLAGIMNVFVSGVVAQFINQLASVVLIKILIISGSVLAGGIIMLVIAKIIKCVQKRRNKANV